jgi:hypothetical protein
VKELSESKETDVPVIEEEEKTVKKTVFSRMAFSSSESESESSSSEEVEANEIEKPAPQVVVKSQQKQKPTQATQKKDKKKLSQPEPEKQQILSASVDDTVKIDIRMLNPANELRRIFGNQIKGKKSAISKRRHWLVEPAKEWPLVVRDMFRMELTKDKSFRLVPEQDYENKMKILARIVASHDVDALYQFIQYNPFHVHALIQLALILIDQRKEYENAYELIKRAVFALQSAFMPSFHPDKSVLLSRDSLFTSTLLRCLLLYAHLLAGQGCVRTSLEVYKLIYLMDGGMGTGCPMTHVLLHLDAAAFKADQFDFLSRFVAQNGLAEILPGTALLFAISQKLRGVDVEDIKHVTNKDLKQEVTLETPATVALVKAVINFPGPVKILLGREFDTGANKPADVLTNKLTQAFNAKILAVLKTKDEIVRWIDRVVKDLIPIFARDYARGNKKREWLKSAYGNITTAEFEWGQASGAGFVEPSPILETESEIMDLYLDDEYALPRPSQSSAPGLSQPVSLESNPIAAFLQTLLPWARVDHTGTEATPFTMQSLLDRMNATIASATGQDSALIREAGSSSSGSVDGDEEEEEDEIVME